MELSEQFETEFAHIFVCEKLNQITFKAITATDDLWTKTKSYALACPWRAGKSLAKPMDQNAFTNVYLVSDHDNLYEKYGFEVIDHVMASWGTEQKIYMHKVNI